MPIRKRRPADTANGHVSLLPRLREAAGFGRFELIHADALDWLSAARPNSIHAVVKLAGKSRRGGVIVRGGKAIPKNGHEQGEDDKTAGASAGTP